jgi:hypothetical protein
MSRSHQSCSPTANPIQAWTSGYTYVDDLALEPLLQVLVDGFIGDLAEQGEIVYTRPACLCGLEYSSLDGAFRRALLRRFGRASILLAACSFGDGLEMAVRLALDPNIGGLKLQAHITHITLTMSATATDRAGSRRECDIQQLSGATEGLQRARSWRKLELKDGNSEEIEAGQHQGNSLHKTSECVSLAEIVWLRDAV